MVPQSKFHCFQFMNIKPFLCLIILLVVARCKCQLIILAHKSSSYSVYISLRKTEPSPESYQQGLCVCAGGALHLCGGLGNLKIYKIFTNL